MNFIQCTHIYFAAFLSAHSDLILMSGVRIITAYYNYQQMPWNAFPSLECRYPLSKRGSLRYHNKYQPVSQHQIALIYS
ncbi:hypothetical protein BDV35DRAFT_370066 [Aspergillus flavus]|uniref:Uncharacterized protein n=1 Tax=Aspergillus flavus TaxID=5059 RepID=A0A5N6GJL7_ASPFL|nr:hypothetical protein BDV35DRAFT_370066 [Aspergillus flavus]